MRTKFFLLLLIIVIVSSCENLNDIGSIDTDYSVFINLTVNQDKQEFYVYRTLPIDSAINGYPYGSNDEFFIDKPYIAFTDEDGNVFDNFALEQRRAGYVNRKFTTNQSNFDVLENEIYTLRINVNDDIISSEVKTLSKIDNFEIDIGDLVEEGSDKSREVTIYWGNPSNSHYFIFDREYYYVDSVFYNDSLYLFEASPNRSDYIAADKDFYSRQYKVNKVIDSLYIKITAYDENHHKHFYRHNDQVNVKNAYGYVGSSSVIDTLIRFQ